MAMSDEPVTAGKTPKKDIGPPTLLPPLTCRGVHNEWERVVKKRHSVTLSCLVCGNHWKTKLDYLSKCRDFYKGSCERGGACPNPHIYSRAYKAPTSKRKRKQRQETPSSPSTPQDAHLSSCSTTPVQTPLTEPIKIYLPNTTDSAPVLHPPKIAHQSQVPHHPHHHHHHHPHQPPQAFQHPQLGYPLSPSQWQSHVPVQLMPTPAAVTLPRTTTAMDGISSVSTPFPMTTSTPASCSASPTPMPASPSVGLPNPPFTGTVAAPPTQRPSEPYPRPPGLAQLMPHETSYDPRYYAF